jgi:hypothetical protein
MITDPLQEPTRARVVKFVIVLLVTVGALVAAYLLAEHFSNATDARIPQANAFFFVLLSVAGIGAVGYCRYEGATWRYTLQLGLPILVASVAAIPFGGTGAGLVWVSVAVAFECGRRWRVRRLRRSNET